MATPKKGSVTPNRAADKATSAKKGDKGGSPATKKTAAAAAEDSDRTIRLHRVIKAPAEVIYRAMLHSGPKCKWSPPSGFYAEMEKNDFVVGGERRMAFINMRTGDRSSSGGRYLELQPNERIQYADKFGSLPGEVVTTVMLKEVMCGTELNIVQEGMPSMIPLPPCYVNWQGILNQLAALVEADIPSQ
jgi:uncharacterized protein YndB with AHSA1/START domain